MLTSTSTAPSQNEPPNPNSPPPLPSTFLHPGTLTLLLGDPGVGKSLLALDLAARLTNNSLPPPHPHIPRDPIDLALIPDDQYHLDYQPATICAISMEDAFDTIVSRLHCAGMNRDNVRLPKHRLSLLPHNPPRATAPAISAPLNYRHAAKNDPPSLLSFLMEIIPQCQNFRLLILDPLPAFLGTSADASPALTRSLLQPLIEFAEYHRFAVLGISHLNKSTHKKELLHRALGSLIYPALARTVYLLIKHHPPAPTTPTTPQAHGLQSVGSINSPDSLPSPHRLLIPLKNNLAPITHALAFNITPQCNLQWNPNPVTNHPLLDNSHHSPCTPESLPHLFAKSQLDFALEFLQSSLAAGPIPVNQLLKQARSIGIAQRTLERARFQLQTKCRKDPTANQWLIHPPLPPTTIPQPTAS